MPMKMEVYNVKRKGEMRKFGRKSYYLSFSINTFIFSLLILKIFANQSSKNTKASENGSRDVCLLVFACGPWTCFPTLIRQICFDVDWSSQQNF